MAEDVDPIVTKTSFGNTETVTRKSEQGASQPHPLHGAHPSSKSTFPTPGLLGDSPVNPAKFT